MNQYVTCDYCGERKHISEVELLETETDEAIICFACRNSIEQDEESPDELTLLRAENARLRRENEELESLLTETVTTLTQAVETLARAQFEIVQRKDQNDPSDVIHTATKLAKECCMYYIRWIILIFRCVLAV